MSHVSTPRPFVAMFLAIALTFFGLGSVRADIDVNKDGKPDLLWQNRTTGDLIYWLMNGFQYVGFGYIAHAVPTEWKLVGTPDLNADGKWDLVWQDVQTGDVAYWLMNGTTRTGYGYIARAVALEWKLVCAVDLNGDGKADLLWHNQSTGDVAYWLMNGITRTTYGYIATGVSLDWKLVGACDLTRDGKMDLLWQNRKSGESVYWSMNGLERTGYGYFATGMPAEWEITGVSDLDKDGNTDLLWQNIQTGDVIYWQMNHVARTSSGSVRHNVALDWDIAGMQASSALTYNVYMGAALANGLDMGVDSSGSQHSWVINHQGYMECRYPAGQSWGAVFVTTYPITAVIADRKTVDITNYRYLVVELKGTASGEQVALGVKTETDPDDGSEPKQTVTCTANWQTIRIPLSALTPVDNPIPRMSHLYVLTEFVFGGSAKTVSFRNIRFER